MANSVVNSPNSTFETEDTIKLNSSIISSASTSNFHNSMVSHNINDQFYQYDTSMINAPFNPLPPPPINMSHSASFSNSNSHSNSNHFNSSSRASSTDSSNNTQEFVSAGAMGPNTTISDYFNGNEYSIPNSSHYSIFSNQQAMNSTISFHNDSQNNQQIFKLNMDSTSDILNDYSISNSQNTDLMYNLTEFELGNPSLESIPDTMLHHNQLLNGASFLGLSQSYNNPNGQATSNPNDSTLLNYALPSYNSTNDITQYPYTPTISDAYTPTVSETSSYTPNSSSNNNPTSNTNVDVTTEEFSIRAPVPLLLKSLSYSSSSPNLGSHKVTKKPSIARMNSNSALNNKKSLVISTQITNPSSNTPISESSPQMLGISPLCNKYKGLDIYHQPSPISARSVSNASICSNGSNTSTNTPNKSLMPPLNTFRHNSEVGPTTNYYETPRRKTFPNADGSKPRKQAMRKTSKGALVINANQPGNTTASLNGNDASSEGKPKKYTRRRLLPRSKNGCWICRIKHLKCDELRPVCTSCSKFGIECDYSPTKPGYVTDKQLRKEKLLSISMVRKQKQKSVGGVMLDQDEEDYAQSAIH